MGEPGTKSPKSEKAIKADSDYTMALAKATEDNPDQNVTGYADVYKVLMGSSLKEAGYDKELKAAYDNSSQGALFNDETYTTMGTYTKQEKSKRKAEKAAKETPLKADIVEEEEAEEDDGSCKMAVKG